MTEIKQIREALNSVLRVIFNPKIYSKERCVGGPFPVVMAIT